MFDIGFSELIVIALVALIVIGPERLPRVARTVGALLGRAQRYVNEVKSDIQREVNLDELKDIGSTFQNAAKEMEQSVNQLGSELNAAGESLNQSIAGPAETKTETKAEAATLTSPEQAQSATSAQMDLGLESKPAADRARPADTVSKA